MITNGVEMDIKIENMRGTCHTVQAITRDGDQHRGNQYRSNSNFMASFAKNTINDNNTMNDHNIIKMANGRTIFPRKVLGD